MTACMLAFLPQPSLRRKRGSRATDGVCGPWIPACAGMTGGTSGLLGFDDRAPDRAGAYEPFVQHLTVAAADRPLQGGQILAEPLQEFQDRLAVGEKDVAPHDRVGGGDAGEVAETAGGIGDDLG